MRVLELLLPLATRMPFYLQLSPAELIGQLLKSEKDVLEELTRLANGGRAKVVSRRVHLLAAAMERRMPNWEALIDLMPLMADDKFISWVRG